MSPRKHESSLTSKLKSCKLEISIVDAWGKDRLKLEDRFISHE